ncbi:MULTISPECIES: hypothetical protein [unclassified Nocardioides]|uniref:hypothetical protein n=1 Tax=unclassified Nocardioides TaxID=2615069 RepID=UPI0012E36F6F|nr:MULTISPECIES: hypothetical protein [unclassified Nocardioides]
MAVPAPPPGTRWQGINEVVVAVPRTWATSTEPCQPAAPDTVWLTSDATPPVPCPLVRARGSVLHVDSADLGPLRLRTEVRGVELRHGGVRCRAGASGPCTLDFAVPSLAASFHLFYLGPSPSAFVRRMMRSLTVLPPGLTTVPVIPYGAEVTDAMDLLGTAGLRGRSPQVDFPHYVTGTRPQAGLLARDGDAVRLTIGDG